MPIFKRSVETHVILMKRYFRFSNGITQCVSAKNVLWTFLKRKRQSIFLRQDCMRIDFATITKIKKSR